MKLGGGGGGSAVGVGEEEKSENDKRRRSSCGSESNSGGGRIVTPNLKIFTLAELKSATRNFRPDSVLGEGGFGRVFKGWIDQKTYAPSKRGVGIPIAVKRSYYDHAHRLQEWQVPRRPLSPKLRSSFIQLGVGIHNPYLLTLISISERFLYKSTNLFAFGLSSTG